VVYFKILSRVILSGVMVIVLAIGPRVRGSNPAESDGILRALKSAARLPSEGK
jgi:hypothetical protein